MADLLIVTSGLSGMLFSSLELARRMSAAGHDVVYASLPEVRETVEALGVEFVALEPSRYTSFLKEDQQAGVVQRLMHLGERRRRGVESLAVSEFGQTLEQRKPDLVLIDIEMHEHVMVAASSSSSVALLNSFVSIWRQAGLPPPHHQVQPGAGFWGSGPGLQLLWTQLRLRKVTRRSWQKLRRLGCDRVSLLRSLAASLGFPFDQHADFGQWLMPLVLRGFPVLSLHARELDFPHQPPEEVHYVGPMMAERRSDDAREDPARREELERIFERRKTSSGSRKLVYAGFGSFFTADRGFLQRLFGCFSSRPEWELVLTLGGQTDGSFWESDSLPDSLPENVHVFPWVPQLELLEHADAALVHGGTNTAEECVVAQVPMLVYCGHETDMAGTTARIEYHGLGMAGQPLVDSPDEIAQQIERLLNDSGFKDRLQAMSRSCLRYRDDRVAEAVVDSLLAGTAAPRDTP
jgi:UDP:flavonoid glycosyltransferase YjiC (YdhE family)